MNLNSVIDILTHKHGYKNVEFDEDPDLIKRLRQRNLEVWKNTNRYIVTKGYTSDAHFDTWYYDQVFISFIYDVLPARYKNNLYFLLILDWEGPRSEELLWRITEGEKNHRVCRKYVIDTPEDLERVPSLNDKFGESSEEFFDFDSEFKMRLFASQDTSEKSSGITERIRDIVDLYFEMYDDESEEKLEQQKKRIQLIFEGVNRDED